MGKGISEVTQNTKIILKALFNFTRYPKQLSCITLKHFRSSGAYLVRCMMFVLATSKAV